MGCQDHQDCQVWLVGRETKANRDQPLLLLCQDPELKVTKVLQDQQVHPVNLDYKDVMDLQAHQVRKEILDCLVTVVYQDSRVRVDQQVNPDRRVNLELMGCQDQLV